MNYGLLADVLVVFHAAFVGFVVFGQLAIVIGIICRWQWVRNFWFRTIHLLCIGYVAMESLVGLACPLTIWEQELRNLAGQPNPEGSFVGRLVHTLMFCHVEEWILDYTHIGFGVLVLLTFVLARPRLPAFLARFRRPAGVAPQSAVSR